MKVNYKDVVIRAILTILLIIFLMLHILQNTFLPWMYLMALAFFPSIILTLIMGHFIFKRDSWKFEYKASMIFTYLILQIIVIPLIFFELMGLMIIID